MKKEKSIIFSTEMVKAILEGRKTETRRVIKPQPDYVENGKPIVIPRGYDYVNGCEVRGNGWSLNCPYGKLGDILYVRESFAYQKPWQGPGDEIPDWVNYIYKASDSNEHVNDGKWKPSIHMPKEAARIWLKIEDMKVERVQDIPESNAINEGIERFKDGLYKNYGLGITKIASPLESFYSLWNSINGKDSWNNNPFVWAILFKVLSTTGKPLNL